MLSWSDVVVGWPDSELKLSESEEQWEEEVRDWKVGEHQRQSKALGLFSSLSYFLEIWEQGKCSQVRGDCGNLIIKT